MIKKVSIPLCGVMLGLSALGNLWLAVFSSPDGSVSWMGPALRMLCGLLALFCLVLLLSKAALYPAMLREDMKNPIMASVSGTFPMALMLLSTYIKPFAGAAAYGIWMLSILLHVLLILYFTIRFFGSFDLSKVFASYYIVYVGIAVASVTAEAYGERAMKGIGTMAFWFGLATFLILLVIVTLRYLLRREIPDPARPLFCIYAAPASLLIAAYVTSVTPKSRTLLVSLFALSVLLYLLSLSAGLRYVRKYAFYPSFAALTFPYVITAIATKKMMGCMAKLGSPMPYLQYVLWAEAIIATLFTGYVFFKFLSALFGPAAGKAAD